MSSFHSIQSMYTAVYYHRTSRVFDFMIADALSMAPDFISEIVSEVDEFLEYDDLCRSRKIQKIPSHHRENQKRSKKETGRI